MNTPFQAIADALRAHQRFVVISHVRPDGDALGCTVAMALSLKALGKEVAVWNEEGPLEKLAFLSGSALVQRPPAEPQEFDVVLALDTAVRDAIRPLLSELRSTLSAYEQTHPGTVIERLLLTGGGAAMPGLADELSRIGNVPVEVVEPMRHVGVRRGSKHSAPDEAARVATAVCLGLAMGAAA